MAELVALVLAEAQPFLTDGVTAEAADKLRAHLEEIKTQATEKLKEALEQDETEVLEAIAQEYGTFAEDAEVGAVLGLILGVGVSLGVSRFGIPLDPEVYYIDALPIVLDPVELAVTTLGAVFIALLAALYPARKAAQLHPVEGLRLG